jgi:hypothetical protein
VARLLISHGANREATTQEERTPLEMGSPAFARGLRN